MTLQEMLIEIPRLTTREQLLLLDTLSRALNAEFSKIDVSPNTIHESAVDRLYGAFNPTHQELSNEEVDRIRFEAMMEKHS